MRHHKERVGIYIFLVLISGIVLHLTYPTHTIENTPYTDETQQHFSSTDTVKTVYIDDTLFIKKLYSQLCIPENNFKQ